jgi:hypothetical protein
VFGADCDGNSQPNAVDIAPYHVGSVRASNIRCLSPSQFQWVDRPPMTRWICDNFGYANGVGTPGVTLVYNAYATSQTTSLAAKSGSGGMRVTPLGTGIEYEPGYGVVELFVPIASGQNLAVSVYGRRHGLSSDCADIQIDPEQTWFGATATGTSEVSAEDEWYEYSASTSGGARGSGLAGMCRVILRLKEYTAGAYFDWADFSVEVS